MKNLEKKNKTRLVILVIVIAAIIGVIILFESQKANPTGAATVVTQEINEGDFLVAPELAGISGYLNTDGEEIKIEDYRGKVVLIDFWTYTCINCLRTLPYLTAWDEKYKDKGLVIIGVHTPEFEFEKKPENVQSAIEKHGIKYPVVQDNDYVTWSAFQNRYWPRKYLIDSQGFIRYDHIGEGGYEETEAKIQELLAEIDQDVSDISLTEETPSNRQQTTPELYAGYDFALSRGQNIGNEGGLRSGQVITYDIPQDVEISKIYLAGTWQSNPDDLLAIGEENAIILEFIGQEVNIVADTMTGIPVEMEVFIDGKYILPEQAGYDVQFVDNKAIVIIDEPRLYNIVQGEHGVYGLELNVGKDFNFNAFTFG